MHRFAIVRILGNETPPRDNPGSRLRTLHFILNNEPVFPDTIKLYVLNRIVDDSFKAKLITLLDEYSANYIELPIDWPKLAAADELTDDQLNLEVIGINAARNKAIEFGHRFADFSIIFDGDCLFDSNGWELFESAVTERCQKFYRYYFSIPTIRTSMENYNQKVEHKLIEPMPVFHRDSLERFDEKLLFGRRDKLELLFRLGHDSTPHEGHCRIIDGQTSLAGYCCHLQTGEEIVELQAIVRSVAREASLQSLYRKVRNKIKTIRDKCVP